MSVNHQHKVLELYVVHRRLTLCTLPAYQYRVHPANSETCYIQYIADETNSTGEAAGMQTIRHPFSVHREHHKLMYSVFFAPGQFSKSNLNTKWDRI